MTEKQKISNGGLFRIRLAVGFLLLMALAAVGYWFIFMFGIVSSDDARFDGDLVAIAPQIKGNLLEVRVAEGDKVKSGQILFIIEKEALEVALNKAEAELKSAKADLLMAKANNSKILRGSRPEEIHMAEAVEQ